MARKNTKSKNIAVEVANLATPIVGTLFKTASSGDSSKLWTWGEDNLFPLYLEVLARRNAVHRGIMNNKADYISGRGLVYDEANVNLTRVVNRANMRDTLHEVVSRVIYDKVVTGNGFMELVIRGGRIVFFHHDATTCRVMKPNDEGESRIAINKDWMNGNNKDNLAYLPIYPIFEKQSDGTMRAMLHIADYEPTFKHYGVPAYIAGLNSIRIGTKTGSWNESRLDKSFQPSGIINIVSPENDEEILKNIVRRIKEEYEGAKNAGKVLVTVSDDAGGATFTPIQSDNEGDWLDLHNVSKNDIVTAHSWFIALSGLDYSTGISADRVLSEYNVALNTIIKPEQARILAVLRGIFNAVGVDATSLDFINTAPIIEKPTYMRVWEARKADGLDYDENDPVQQIFLADLLKANSNGSNNAQ